MASEAAASAASAATDTIRIWAKYRNNRPVEFILSASATVSALKDRVINQTLMGFGEYSGPIDIYESESGEMLFEEMLVSVVRPSSRPNPLIIRIPTSGNVSCYDFVTADFLDHSVTQTLIWFSIALVFMVVGLALINNADKDLQNWRWTVESGG
jgi:hypothetical protein